MTDSEYRELIVRQVTASMAIEGIALTEDDKERIRNFAADPEDVKMVVKQLIKKHCVQQ